MPTGQSKGLGYSDTDLEAVPEGADLGLGCGNPNAIAALKAGETSSTSAQVAASTPSSPRARWGRRVA